MDYAQRRGFIERATPITIQLYCEPLQKFRLAAEGHGPHQPPDRERDRIRTYFDPLPLWYPPFEEQAVDLADYPLHAITQRPMTMYHSWGSQNAWLRQIMADNRLYVNRDMAVEVGVGDDDWVWIISHHGRIRGRVRLMDGTNPNTVWTWNAIARQSGAAGLAKDAPEATQGFLLNHVISELLPEKDGGYRYANADPVTGQAAWYDLRVRLERAEPPAEGHFDFPDVGDLRTVPSGSDTLRYGAEFRATKDCG